jgi:CheY-like chemotaxis protein
MILVVDDDLAFFQKAQAVLANAVEPGILFAQDAAQALKLLGSLSDEFTVALIDLDLPGVNGFDLISQIRTKYPQLPVIAMSGVFQPSVLESAKAVGAVEVLSKPITKKWESTLERIRIHHP